MCFRVVKIALLRSLLCLVVLEEVASLASIHADPRKGAWQRYIAKSTKWHPSGREQALKSRSSSRSDLHRKKQTDLRKRTLQPSSSLSAKELTSSLVHKSRCEESRNWQPIALANVSTPRIPQHLILTGRNESISKSHPEVQANIRNLSRANPAVPIRWFGDKACFQYLQAHYDDELVYMFQNEVHGSFRGDICRTAVLLREGGFYMDLDVQLVVPLQTLINDTTSFMSVYEAPEVNQGGILNALLAAEPGSAVMNETLNEIRKWYRGEVQTKGWMGPVTLLRGIDRVVERDCPCTALNLRKRILQWPRIDPQWSCGPHAFRLMVQRHLLCKKPYRYVPEECPAERHDSTAYAVRQGLFFPGKERRFIGWPRPAWCAGPGCGFGGWTDYNISDDLLL